MTAIDLLYGLGRAALFMTLAMVTYRVIVHSLNVRSAGLHRWMAVIVLVQGWCLGAATFDIPWYEPVTSTVAGSPTSSDGNVKTAKVFSVQDRTRPAKSGLPIGPSQPKQTPTWGRWFSHAAVAVWLGGIAFGVATWVIQYIWFWLTLRRTEVHSEWREQWEQIVASYNLTNRVRFLVSPSRGPLLCLLPTGYALVVPSDRWQQLSVEQRRSVLRHELAHYRNGDVWKSWIMYMLVLPQWFNPVAWWALRFFRESGEWQCDDNAADTQQERLTFVQALQLLVVEPQVGMTAVARYAQEHPLLSRFRRLLLPSRLEDSTMKKCSVIGLIAAIAVTQAIQFKLVAKEPKEVTVESVKEGVQNLDDRLEDLIEQHRKLEEKKEQIGAEVEARIKELKAYAKDTSQHSAEFTKRIAWVESGDSQQELNALEGADKLGDEGVIIAAVLAKETLHDEVRTKAMEVLGTLGDDGIAGFAFAVEALTQEELVSVAKIVGKTKTEKHMILLLALAVDGDIVEAVLPLRKGYENQPLFLIGLAGEDPGDERIELLLKEITGLPKADALTLLYGIAKKDETHQTLALEAAMKFGADGLPIMAVCFQSEVPETRKAVIVAAQKFGGDVANFVIEKALEDDNPDLRKVAEEIVNKN